jgi:SulP family sulfate permease
MTSSAALPTRSFWQTRVRETATSWREMLSSKTIASDLAAGVTVACVALPLNLALALASGVPAGVGVVTAVIAGSVAALSGGSRLQVTGPAAAMAPLAFEIVQRHGARGLVVAAFLAGLMQMTLGLARVGRLVQTIPATVVSGFMSGIGLLIIGGQIPRILGLAPTVRSVSALAKNTTLLGDVNYAAVAIGLFVLTVTVLLPKVSTRIPAALIALVVVTAFAAIVGIDLRVVGAIPRGIPTPSLPSFGSVDLVALFPEALAMCALASAESLLSAVVVDSMAKTPRHSSDQELVGQGLANIASSLFGGLPVTGVIVRSSVAVQSGGRTRMTPFSHAVTLLVMMVAAAPLVARVPIAALAGVLLAVGIRLVDWRQLRHAWRISRFEAVVFVATMLGIVFTDFIDGVMIGLVLALVQFAHRHRALRIDVAENPRGAAGEFDGPSPRHSLETGAHVTVVRVGGPIFFVSHAGLDTIAGRERLPPYLVLDLADVPSIDVTGCETLVNLANGLKARNTAMLVARATASVRETLERGHVIPHTFDQRVHASVDAALRAATSGGPGTLLTDGQLAAPPGTLLTDGQLVDRPGTLLTDGQMVDGPGTLLTDGQMNERAARTSRA